MSRSLTAALAEHAESDLTVKVLRGLLGVLPFAPAARWFPDIQSGTGIPDPETARRVAERIEALSAAPGPQAALATFDFLDKGDKGIALFSGLRGAVKAVRGEGATAALETDPQQAADAALKALGIAYAIHKLYPGSPTEKVARLTASEPGRVLLAWFVAVDVVLPFADNLASGGTDLFDELIQRYTSENAARLQVVAGPEAQEAVGMLGHLSGTLKAGLGQAAAFAQPMSAWAQRSLPGVLGAADGFSSVVATSLDALSSYRLLGAQLVLDALMVEAVAQVEAENAQKQAAAVAAAAQREAEEADRRAQSKQREDYSLGEAVEAASAKNVGIKYTRSEEIEKASAGPPAKKGCMGCGGVLLLGVVLSGAAAAGWWA